MLLSGFVQFFQNVSIQPLVVVMCLRATHMRSIIIDDAQVEGLHPPDLVPQSVDTEFQFHLAILLFKCSRIVGIDFLAAIFFCLVVL